MKKDRLKLKIELQTAFENENIRSINQAIFLSKVVRFLNKDSTIFFISLIPFLATTIYYLFNSDVQTAAFVGLILLLVHYPIYKFFYCNFLFKNSKDDFDEYNATIEILEEIKFQKLN